MSLPELLDQLVRLEARAKAANALATPIRQKATALIRERYEAEGSDRFVRPGAVVSLVKPTPYPEVARPEALCNWLTQAGRDDLVTKTVTVVDTPLLISAVETAAEGKTPNPTLLLEAVDVRSQPLADWHRHLTFDVTPDGTLVTPDGEPIPGVRWVVPEPTSIRVALDKQVRAQAEAEAAQVVA